MYIDTNIFVYAIENHPRYGKSCTKILADIQADRLEAFCSILVLVELLNVLVKLNRSLSADAEKKIVVADNIRAVLSLPITWIELDPFIVENAAAYDYGISGIDYVHIASMMTNSITEIVSADRELDKASSIRRIDPIDYKC